MNKDKKIYVIYGSEDGILGTCSNMKNAYKVASDYFYNDDVKLKSYSQVCNEFKKHPDAEMWSVDIATRDDCCDSNSTITKTYLNERV